MIFTVSSSNSLFAFFSNWPVSSRVLVISVDYFLFMFYEREQNTT